MHIFTGKFRMARQIPITPIVDSFQLIPAKRRMIFNVNCFFGIMSQRAGSAGALFFLAAEVRRAWGVTKSEGAPAKGEVPSAYCQVQRVKKGF